MMTVGKHDDDSFRFVVRPSGDYTAQLADAGKLIVYRLSIMMGC
jgi:hypothetical protein